MWLHPPGLTTITPSPPRTQHLQAQFPRKLGWSSGKAIVHFLSPSSSFWPAILLGWSLVYFAAPPDLSSPIVMVRIREIPRTATFAWSPGAQVPLLATGTRAGAVDFDFSNETNLELWDLGLNDKIADSGSDLQPLVKVPTESGWVILAH